MQWKQVDLEARTISDRAESLARAAFSTEDSREQPHHSVWGALAQALSEQLKNAAHTRAEDFVFCKSDGAPLNPDVLRRDVLYPALDRLGISRNKGSSGFHTFRHSAASFINSQTGNLKLAQKLLGHSSINMTADVYTHTSAESEREAALAVERAIYGDLFQICSKVANKNSSAAIN